MDSFAQPLDHNYLSDEAILLSEDRPNGDKRSLFSISRIHCGSCVARIESELSQIAGIKAVRVNLTLKRVRIDWDTKAGIDNAIYSLRRMGFEPQLINELDHVEDRIGKRYLRATAIAGFAAGNIMMLSVAVWSGATDANQFLFHFLSALLALIAVFYSGSIFFHSAWSALKCGKTNMDVPISVGILLSIFLGLYDMFQIGTEVYFEAATMLIFFLLVGRTLDHFMRQRAATSLDSLTRIAPRIAFELKRGEAINTSAETVQVPTESITVDSYLLVPANQRVPLDSVVVYGSTQVDTSIVNGESLPVVVEVGDELDAGVKILGSAIVIKSRRTEAQSFLSRTQRLVESTAMAKGRFTTLSETVSRWYAPVVHSAAFGAGSIWYFFGADLHTAITIAIAVLIITCPCALGLAVPMVQVLATGRLFKQGVIVNNSSALEKLPKFDTVVFDKTGTLSHKKAYVKFGCKLNNSDSTILYAMARRSSHPYAQSIANALEKRLSLRESDITLDSFTEYPGKGAEAIYRGVVYRLGALHWIDKNLALGDNVKLGSTSGFSANGNRIVNFEFNESIRDEAVTVVSALKSEGFHVHIASGDKYSAVEKIAGALRISHFIAESSPEQKSTYVNKLKEQGHNVLMVGDGINDTVALSAADVSIALHGVGDLGANSADLVLTKNSLEPILAASRLTRRTRELVYQNIVLALIYNLVAMPLAFIGLVSPLVAAVAMSISSLLVVANSLRLNIYPLSNVSANCADTSASGFSHG